MNKINVGLIGFSIAGQVFHAPFIVGVEELHLYKVVARKADQQEILKTRYPDAISVATVEEVINDEAIDLVVIATSNDVHYSLAKQALEAGKHVVVEKPFTITSAEADELIRIAEQKKLLLTVHHNARFHSDFKTVRKVIASGRLGKIVNYEVRYDRFRNFLRKGAWREEDLPGSGIHYDLGAHLIDQSLQLFGKPESIFADLRKQREDAQAIDDFEFILSYPGLKVSLKGQMLAKIPTSRFAVYGWNGCFVKNGVDPQEELLRHGATPHLIADWGQEPASIYGTLALLENGKDIEETIPSETGSGLDFYRNVAQVLKGTEKLIVEPGQARDVIRLLELAELSWSEKRTIPVTGELIS